MTKNKVDGRENSNPAFRSWGEEQLARLFERNKIAYQYEYPLAIQDQGKVRVYYPDFRLPEYGLIVEYFGVNNDPAYDKCTEHKMEVYRRAGVDGLFLTRNSLRGDWPARILGKIEGILQARLDRFCRLRKRTGGIQNSYCAGTAKIRTSRGR